jgi:hypothetical protein
MLWMVTVGLARTRRTTRIVVSSISSAFQKSSVAFPVRDPDSDVENVTAEPITVTAPITSGHGKGSGESRRAISRIKANRTTCTSVASLAASNAVSR